MVNIEYLDSDQDKGLASVVIGGSYRISIHEDINKEGRSVFRTRVPSLFLPSQRRVHPSLPCIDP
tara:strand:+ start:306 stop:500 length:195 start_codon:yes stop_codon:yes gene_type:complete